MFVLLAVFIGLVAVIVALLAEELRPTAGHPERLVGPAARIWGRDLAQWRERNRFHIIFWGPPGAGKTTLARMLSEASGLHVRQLSAVRDGVREIRDAVESTPGGLLFIDEIHRLNKAQQDTLLPILENEEVWAIGATTESPSVALNPAILSRVRTIRVTEPSESDVGRVLKLGLDFLVGKSGLELEPERRKTIENLMTQVLAPRCEGDVRSALNLLESLFFAPNEEAMREILENSLRAFGAKEHYDWVSAMIKSMRGSDPDAALVYAIHSLDSGEDPLFILRRCVIFASEDVGNADPQALEVAVNAYRAVECVGLPEGAIPLAQCVTYLASTVKSNRSYKALHTVRDWLARVRQQGENLLEPPRELTRKGREHYKYPHDFPDAFVLYDYLPKALANIRRTEGPAYQPCERGFEGRIATRLASLWSRKSVQTRE